MNNILTDPGLQRAEKMPYGESGDLEWIIL